MPLSTTTAGFAVDGTVKHLKEMVKTISNSKLWLSSEKEDF